MQGERKLSDDNKSLGLFNLSDIPLAPRGIPQIEVAFEIDANGILSVTAKENETNQNQMITISDVSTLSSTEVDSMLKEAAANETHDFETITLRNLRYRCQYLLEKTITYLSKIKQSNFKVKATF